MICTRGRYLLQDVALNSCQFCRILLIGEYFYTCQPFFSYNGTFYFNVQKYTSKFHIVYQQRFKKVFGLCVG